MKFSGNRASIANAAKWVSKAIPRNPSTPILAGMLLEATADGLTLSAFDFDLSMSATIEGITTETGKVVVPGYALASFLSAARGAQADLVASKDLVVQSAASSSVFRTLEVKDYPELPKTGTGEKLGDLSGDVLGDVVRRLSALSSREQTAVKWEEAVSLKSNTTSLTVTSGVRYAIGQQTIPLALGEFDLVLPASRLQEALADFEGGIGLYQDGGALSIVSPSRTASLRMFEDRFPGTVDKMLSPPHTATIKVNREDFAASLKLANTASDRVKVSVSDGEMVVASHKPEKGGEAKSEITDVIECECDASGSFIAAQKYLGAVVGAMTEETMEIRFTPDTIKAAGVTDGRSRFVFMPTKGE